ncbi:hypothetical protein Droror1_Dr00021274 [Drosera rotundifolia]
MEGRVSSRRLGRLPKALVLAIDLINSNSLKLNVVHFLVLDEADQILAVGFEEDEETILEKLPSERQSMLFSATMLAWVKKLARKHLDNPLIAASGPGRHLRIVLRRPQYPIFFKFTVIHCFASLCL